MRQIATILLAATLLLSCTACAQTGNEGQNTEKTNLSLNTEVKPATEFTTKTNAAVYDQLDFNDKQEYEFATRGLIDAPETLELKDEDGNIIWSQEAYAFLEDYEKAPDSVNPSLWENTKNNHVYGLFEVCEGIYQVRGYDMANLTVVKGDTGWIVFDTLMSVECSQAAMQLIEKNLGKFPVKAVIISHSHADHFGGITGVMAEEDKADSTQSIEEQLASGKIPVITPEGFTEHSVKENVYAGKGMGRRTNYQYGVLLTPGVTGKLAQGIGMGQSTGTVSFLTPSYEIRETGEKMIIDGVELWRFDFCGDTYKVYPVNLGKKGSFLCFYRNKVLVAISEIERRVVNHETHYTIYAEDDVVKELLYMMTVQWDFEHYMDMDEVTAGAINKARNHDVRIINESYWAKEAREKFDPEFIERIKRQSGTEGGSIWE